MGKNLAQKGIILFGIVILVGASFLFFGSQSDPNEDAAWISEEDITSNEITVIAPSSDHDGSSSQTVLNDSMDKNRLVLKADASRVKGFATISGYVLREDRSPVADAKVKALRIKGLERSLQPDQYETFETTSAGDGGFAFKRVPVGDYALLATSADTCGKGMAMAAYPTDYPFTKCSPTEIILKQGGSISGRVVDPDGNPISKAWVLGGNATAALTHTDGEGRFEMGPLPLDLYSITAGAKGWASEQVSSIPVGKTGIEIQLTKGGFIIGEVFCDDSPLAGITIRAGGGAEHCDAVTDKTGRFELGPLGEAKHALQIFSQVYTQKSKPQVPVGRDEIVEGIRIDLYRGGSISGTVVHGSHNVPVAGAWVYAIPKSQYHNLAITKANSGCTDAEGEYCIPLLSPQEYRVEALSTGSYQGKLWNEGTCVKVSSDGVVENVDFHLEPGATVYLQVNDENGVPVTNAMVSFDTKETDRRMDRRMGIAAMLPHVEEKENGSYLIQGIPPGAYKITASKNGMGSDGCTHVVNSGDKVASLTLTLCHTFELPGMVKDKGNKGIPGALVKNRKYTNNDAILTDENGAFVMGGFTRGGFGSFTIIADGYNPLECTRKNLTENGAPLEFIMEPKGTLSITGRVKDDQGNPVPNVKLTAEDKEHRYITESAYSSADGTFEIKGLNPGTYYLGPDSNHGVRKRHVSQVVKAGASKVRIILERFATVRGTVVDEKGDPVPSFTADLQCKGYYRGRAAFKHCSNGVFEHAQVAPGEFMVRVSSYDGKQAKSEWLTVKPGGVVEGVNLTLSPVGAVSGMVCEYGTKKPIPGAKLFLDKISDLNQRRRFTIRSWMRPDALAEADGTFTIESVEPEDYRLFAGHGDFLDSEGIDIRVEPDRTVENVQVMLSTGAKITGFVFLEGEGVAGVNIHASNPSNSSYKTSDVISGKDGFYCIKNLPPGEYRLNARMDSDYHGCSMSQGKRVTLGETGDRRVDFLFEGSGTIRGRVLVYGKPVAGVRISIHISKKPGSSDYGVELRSHAKTDIMGNFESSRLPAGNYGVKVSVSRDNKIFKAEKQIELSDSGAEVEFRFGDDCSCEVHGNAYASGTPLVEQQVEISAESFSGSVRTDSNGFFRFSDLPSGEVNLLMRVRSKRCSTHVKKRLDLEPGAAIRADLTVLSGGGSVYGSVEIHPESKWFTDRVTMSPLTNGSESTCSFNAAVVDGNYSMDNLPPGMYTVLMLRPWLKSKKVHVSANKATRVDFKYEGGEAGIKGTITVPDMNLEESGEVSAYLFEPGACPFKEGEELIEISYTQGLVAELSPNEDFSFSCSNLPARPLDVVCVRHKDDKTIKIDIKHVELQDEEWSEVALDLKD